VFFVQIQRPERFKTSPQIRFCTILKHMDGSTWQKKWWLQHIDQKLSHCSIVRINYLQCKLH